MRTQKVLLHKQKHGFFFQSMWEKPHCLALTSQLYLKQFLILHVTFSFLTKTLLYLCTYMLYTHMKYKITKLTNFYKSLHKKRL